MKRGKVVIVTVAVVLALAILSTAGTVLAGSGPGRGGSDFPDEDEARIFLGSCPGAPCADGSLKLDGDRLQVQARGFGFPLDPDQTRRLNHYGLCVEDLFIDDDRVESEDARAVQNDGQVVVDGEVRVLGLESLLGLEVTMYLGGDEPNGQPRDAICGTAQVLLRGTVQFFNLR